MSSLPRSAVMAAGLFGTCLGVSAFPISPTMDVLEYVNEITGHYVLLSDGEAAIVDRGGAGPGWFRTGQRFSALLPSASDGSPASAVCRFYSPLYNSHFFTADAAECAALRQPSSGWIYEDVTFRIATPAPECATGYLPVFRLYNNRHMFADANHRFTADPAIRDAMAQSGWSYEGVAFCTSSAREVPESSFAISLPGGFTMNPPNPIVGLAQCAVQGGACIWSDQLPAMPHTLTSYLPISYVQRNPAYPRAADAIVGREHARIWTSQSEPARITAHSFAQVDGTGLGLHIVGRDRLSGPYAGLSPLRVLPGAASPGADERLFPWRFATDRRLVIASDILVKTVQRDHAEAHAYGHPLIQLGDARSGRGFNITLQAFGTMPAGDFVGRDARTGEAIVSTVFREQPLFGEAVGGRYAMCTANSAASCVEAEGRYRFAMRRSDFERALGLARTIDPALSTDPSDYFVRAFGFHAETYLDARLGMHVDGVTLELWYLDRYRTTAD